MSGRGRGDKPTKEPRKLPREKGGTVDTGGRRRHQWSRDEQAERKDVLNDMFSWAGLVRTRGNDDETV